MSEFKYKVSVIVPIYNGSEYLRKCLDSLLKQTIERSQMEVLLINDGSTDESETICEEYTRFYDNFKYFYKENEGLSATRNYGIKRAHGKYIAYLDCDDMYSKETLKNVCDFFDKRYEEIDEVSIPIVGYRNGKTLPLHFRYKFETKTGIYSLDEYPYVSQTTINIVVKNQLESNILFDETPDFRHEDQAYNNAILMQKKKVGFVKEAEYMYNRDNENSIINTYMYPYYIFETTMSYYEKVFSEYEIVPKYIQAMYVHDISWKLKKNILMPYHLQGEEYENAVQRMQLLLDRVEDEIILTCPSTDNFHRHYFMNWKHDKVECTFIADKESVRVEKKGKLILKQQKFEVCLYKLQIEKNNLRMVAFVKSALFNYIGKPRVYAVVQTVDGRQIKHELELTISSESYYHTKVKTNNFWQFNFEYLIDNINFYYIEVEIDGVLYPTYYWFAPTCPYSNEIKNYNSIYKEYTIDFVKNVFYVKKHDLEELKQIRENKTNKYSVYEGVYPIRYAADNMVNKEIWLYYDCLGVDKDNGWYQFQNDFNKDDGIDRYFVNANETKPEMKSYGKNVIQFGGFEHKILYTSASKIITAYVETENICPFVRAERIYYADIAHAQVIYLQHGILHAHLPWKYSQARIEADKIVVSSQFECENFVKKYHFRKQDLILSGMPRYDFMNKSSIPKNKILFAPSWRNYLIGSKEENRWNYTDNKFIKSDYFKYINEFINSPKLQQILEDNDFYMEFKIHPIFKPYLKYFDNNNNRVIFANDVINNDEYKIFITDFSSFVFDFAYYGKAISYFIPDWLQFKSGMNQYRELDLPFDNAFGPWTTKVVQAVYDIEIIIKNGCVPEKIYEERMNNFYLPLMNCRDNLYSYLVEN